MIIPSEDKSEQSMFQGLREICSFKLSIVSMLTDLDFQSMVVLEKKKKFL